jgi:hypothetical protein
MTTLITIYGLIQSRKFNYDMVYNFLTVTVINVIVRLNSPYLD